MKKHSIERKLLASILSFVLCCAMLIGMTFAWFTTSVQSGSNVIKTAAFDAEVYWKETYALPGEVGTGYDFSEWTNLENTTPYYDEQYLPGSNTIRYFAFYNKSDFPVKFDLSLKNIVDSLTVDDNKLADSIVVYETTSVNGEIASPAQMTRLGTLAYIKSQAQTVGDESLTCILSSSVAKQSYKIVAVALELPTDYAYTQSLASTFIVKVIASQNNVPAASETVTVAPGGAATTLTAGGVTVVIPANEGTVDNTYRLDVTDESTITNELSGEKAVTFDATLYLNNEAVTGSDTLYTITMNIGIGASSVYVTHNGTPLTVGTGDQQFTYNAETGELNIYTKSFSPFTVGWTLPEVEVTPAGTDTTVAMTLAGFRAAYNEGAYPDGASVKLIKNVDLTGKTWTPIGADDTKPFIGTFDGNNKTITGMANGDYAGYETPNGTTAHYGATYGFIAFTKGDVTIKDLTLDQVSVDYPNAKVCGALIGNTQPKTGRTNSLTVSNVKVSGSIKGYDKAAGLIGYFLNVDNALIENCTVDGTISISNYANTAAGYRAAGLFGYCSFTAASGVAYTPTIVKDCAVSATISKGESSAENIWTGAISSGFNFKNDMVITNFSFTGTTADQNLVPEFLHDKFSGHGDRYSNFIDLVDPANPGKCFVGCLSGAEFAYYREDYNGMIKAPDAVVTAVRDDKGTADKCYHLTAPAADAEGKYSFTIHGASFTIGFSNPANSFSLMFADELNESRYVRIADGNIAIPLYDRIHEAAAWDWLVVNDVQATMENTYGGPYAYDKLLLERIQAVMIKPVAESAAP